MGKEAIGFKEGRSVVYGRVWGRKKKGDMTIKLYNNLQKYRMKNHSVLSMHSLYGRFRFTVVKTRGDCED